MHGGSGGFLSVNPATSGLKGYSSSVSAYTGKTYTHASNFDGMSIYNGIDVSYHQGTINWSMVKAAGIDFAILRLGLPRLLQRLSRHRFQIYYIY